MFTLVTNVDLAKLGL